MNSLIIQMNEEIERVDLELMDNFKIFEEYSGFDKKSKNHRKIIEKKLILNDSSDIEMVLDYRFFNESFRYEICSNKDIIESEKG